MTTETNDSGLTFKQWYREANAACIAIAGVGLDDLADGPSYDSWQDDCPPDEYAEELLIEEGFPFP